MKKNCEREMRKRNVSDKQRTEENAVYIFKEYNIRKKEIRVRVNSSFCKKVGFGDRRRL
jgi:hypothetical protein